MPNDVLPFKLAPPSTLVSSLFSWHAQQEWPSPHTFGHDDREIETF